MASEQLHFFSALKSGEQVFFFNFVVIEIFLNCPAFEIEYGNRSRINVGVGSVVTKGEVFVFLGRGILWPKLRALNTFGFLLVCL